ncbi:Ap-4 Complex Subunit Epsilon-1 [Manis pentadactyla]|nr:Ap-4 Complex Subunit Epsilon-1 [Manis pentadactyla]
MLRDGHVRLWQDVVQAAVLPIPIERIKDGIRMAAVEKEVSQVTQLTITHKKKKAGSNIFCDLQRKTGGYEIMPDPTKVESKSLCICLFSCKNVSIRSVFMARRTLQQQAVLMTMRLASD